MLNEDLSFSDWYSLRNLDSGIYGADPNDPSRPGDPAECASRPRLITLTPGQHIYRWIDTRKSGVTPADKSSGSWWSTKRGAMRILLESRAAGASSTTEAARSYSNIARSWGHALDEVV
ncbi:MAG: hypothetical protein AB1Z98_33960, partial [Nannocystaceae bacterium]